jgi:hypothetical protein
LNTYQPARERFPSSLLADTEQISFSLRLDQSELFPSAALGAWSLDLRANLSVLSNLATAGVLPTAAFSHLSPLIWRRHPILPMIQTLPMTQSKSPPNYPGASRQFVPFEPTDATAVWQIGVSQENGAAVWPTFLTETRPAAEWKQWPDLTLAALALPGLVLDPNSPPADTGLPLDPDTSLPVQFRFDLPYTDQINALAQLPKVTRDPSTVTPLPDAPPPQPVKPLQRETFNTHWEALSEQAALAGVDARNAFTKENDQTTIQHLIEPFRWPVEANLDLASYPGQLTITNDPANGSAPVSLAGISALEGISGRFAEQGGNRITRVGSTAEPPAPTEFGVRAGSMDAFTANGRFRDQRGLWRAATHTAANFIFTPIQLQNETDDESLIFNLTSAKSAISLEIAEDNIWNFWFRDLPVQPSGEFDRKRRLSEKNQDVNDSEALSREYNHLAGYEWRLGNANGLSIASLDFFPLTLERVQFDENEVFIQV